MNKINLDKSKEKYKNITISKNLDLSIEDGIKKAKKKNRLKPIKTLTAACTLFLVLILGVNTSSVFADSLRSFPLLSGFIDLIEFDKGLKSAAENGFLDNIDYYAEDKGIIFAVNNILYDSTKLVIDYSIYGDGNLYINDYTIKDEDGKKLDQVFIGMTFPIDKKEDGSKRGTIEITKPQGNDKLPKNIKLDIKSFGNKLHEDNEYYSPKEDEDIIEGSWDIPIINLDDEKTNIEPKIYNINKEGELDGYKFLIEDLRIYPTITYMKIKFDENYIFTGFRESCLTNSKGTKYDYKGASILSDNEWDMMFESSYFDNDKNLDFIASGIYFMPKETKYLIFDIENKKILDDGGYGIGYVENEYERDDDVEDIVFEVYDSKILSQQPKNGSNTIDIDWNAQDENGNSVEIDSLGKTSGGEGMKPQIVISINKKYIPKIIKLKINGVYSGNIGNIDIKLK
ncbi:MAG: DUF4179 domain-containing protein [Clostridiaceae bacterium]